LLAVEVEVFGHRVQERLQSTVVADVDKHTIVIMLLLDNQIQVVAVAALVISMVNQEVRVL
jgi:hypothetical protein